MTRTAASLSLVAIALVSLGCDKKEVPLEPSDQASSVPSEREITSSPSGEETGQRTQFSWAALQTWDIKEGISPPGSSSTGETSDLQGSERVGTALPFARLAGGNGRFCGVLRSGPIQCWGKEKNLHLGAYVDVAVGDAAVCGVTSSGGVKCFGAEAPSNLANAKRIAAAGDDICVLDGSGHIACFTTGSESLSPPADLQAKYFAVGVKFACAADRDNKLECWGKIDALNLPADAPSIRDVAAGDGFVCYLTDQGSLRCHGKAPGPLQGSCKALSAGYGNLCAIDDARKAKCVGELNTEFERAARLSVGASAICALDDDGIAQCKGEKQHSQLDVPLLSSAGGTTEQGTRKPLSEEAFSAFLKLFPEVKLPQSFDRNATFDVGDRLPIIYADLVGGAANDYRTGVRLPLSSEAVAVTLLHMPTGKIEIHTFSAKGKPIKFRTLTGRTHESGSVEEQPDGTGSRTFSVSAVESTISAEGLVETTSYQGSEVTYYVNEHIDGSRPVSRILCNITGTMSADSVDKTGNFVRKSARVLPPRSTTDSKGCQGAWPMQP